MKLIYGLILPNEFVWLCGASQMSQSSLFNAKTIVDVEDDSKDSI